MDTYIIFENLLEAWGTSTPNNNRFIKAVKNVKWEHTFEADGELYFCLSNMTLTTCSLNPFDKVICKPSVIFTSEFGPTLINF